MASTVTITKRGAERVRARNVWVYRSDVSDAGGAQAGEIVRVVDGRGKPLGRALYSSRSQIAIRFVSFDDVEVGREFWMARLMAAQSVRDQVVRDATAYRLVYGESDLLPSLIIDRFNDCFVLQTLSQGMEALKQVWVDLLVERYNPRAVVERNEARVRDLEGLARTAGVVYGSDPGEFVIEEGGVRFGVNLLEGQKTGAFLDQRENRIAARSYSRGRAMDCFTFQGGFALHLARGAERVTAIDSSGPAIAQAVRNAELNAARNVEFVEANVFDVLREMEQAGERFDVINLDPPAFAKNRAAIEGATRGYKEINLRAMKLLKPGGTLITSTCSYHMSEDAFLNCISEAAADANRTAQIIERRTQSRDHPVLISMPETYYLKCVILRVV
ncbi:MAG TPA: class I SAM-dependent rRNA methyltransferase [Blastocatellia bacterium]|nr:class I SAM-dependent rRNA methyltransferase [Blastocatellia bacterium]